LRKRRVADFFTSVDAAFRVFVATFSNVSATSPPSGKISDAPRRFFLFTVDVNRAYSCQ